MEFTRTVTVYIDIDEIEKEFMNENLNTKEDLMDCIELHISYLDDCDYYLIERKLKRKSIYKIYFARGCPKFEEVELLQKLG